MWEAFLITVGVIVGLVVIGAIVLGVLFWLLTSGRPFGG